MADDAEVFCLHLAGGMPRWRCCSPAEVPNSTLDLVDALHAPTRTRSSADLDIVDAWETLMEDRPALDRRIPEGELDEALEIFADYADLKSPWYLGHSRAVAQLAASAARMRRIAVRRGDPGPSRWAGSSARGDRRIDRDLEQGHAAQRRRRPSGSGKFRISPNASCPGNHNLLPSGRSPVWPGNAWTDQDIRAASPGHSIPMPARTLAAAVAYQELAEARPNRQALEPAGRRAAVLREVAAGRLDGAGGPCRPDRSRHPLRRRRGRWLPG